MRKALIGLAVVLALGAAGVYLAFHYIDIVVKVALEHWGPEVTGVTIKVDDVAISTADGRGSIRGLEIGSPLGFTSARTARFGEIRVALDSATVTSPVIFIRELVVEAPQIVYEKGAKGTNLDAIQRQINAYVKKGEAADAASSGRLVAKRKLIIESLVIRGGKVTMTAPGLRGQGINFDLPEVQLRDIGKSSNGVTASEAAALVAGALQVKIAQKVLTNMDLLRRGGVEGAIDALKGLLK